MNDWYIKLNNAEHGPLTSERLKQLAQRGKVTPETFVKQGASGTWLRANNVHGLMFPSRRAPAAPASRQPAVPSTRWTSTPIPSPIPHQTPPQTPPMMQSSDGGLLADAGRVTSAQAIPPLDTILKGAGNSSDQLTALADHIQWLRNHATKAKRRRTWLFGRRLWASLAFAYLAVGRLVRGAPVSVFGWPWAVVLVGTTLVGGGLAVTVPWPAALMLSAIVATILSFLMYFPPAATFAETAGALRSELANLPMERNAARQEHLQVLTELAKAEKQHGMMFAELEGERKRHEAAAERRRQEAMATQQAQESREEVTIAGYPRKPGLAWVFPSGALTVVLLGVVTIFVWPHVHNNGIREQLRSCESSGVIDVDVYYDGPFASDVIVFDLSDRLTAVARRIDPVHLLLQFVTKAKSSSLHRIVLAHRGVKLFYVSADDIEELASSYDAGGRIWAFNHLPERCRTMSGTSAYETWSGGWLGVAERQTEDLNSLLEAWE